MTKSSSEQQSSTSFKQPSRVSNIFTPALLNSPIHNCHLIDSLSPRNKIDPNSSIREYSSLTYFFPQPDLVASSSGSSERGWCNPSPKKILLFLEQVGVCLVVAGQPHQRNRQAQPSHWSEIGPSSERGYMAVAGWMTLGKAEKRKADDCRADRRSHTHDPTLAHPTLLNWTELNANLHVLCIESSLFLLLLRAVYSRH